MRPDSPYWPGNDERYDFFGKYIPYQTHTIIVLETHTIIVLIKTFHPSSSTSLFIRTFTFHSTRSFLPGITDKLPLSESLKDVTKRTSGIIIDPNLPPTYR